MGKISETLGKTKDGRSVRFSTPSVGDGEELVGVITEILKHSRHTLITVDEFNLTPKQEGDIIKRHLEHPDKVIIVPKIENKIVGMMDFSAGSRQRNCHQGEFGMSVHPNFQGLGIGRMMLECLIGWGASHPNLEIIRLKVHSQNTKAIRLYESLGFIREGCELKGVKLSPHEYDDVILMALPVK